MLNICGKQANNLRIERSKNCVQLSTVRAKHGRINQRQCTTHQLYTRFSTNFHCLLHMNSIQNHICYPIRFPHYPQHLLLLSRIK